MIQKVVNQRDLRNFSSIQEDLSDWLDKTPEERVAAVEYLRKHRSPSVIPNIYKFSIQDNPSSCVASRSRGLL